MTVVKNLREWVFFSSLLDDIEEGCSFQKIIRFAAIPLKGVVKVQSGNLWLQDPGYKQL